MKRHTPPRNTRQERQLIADLKPSLRPASWQPAPPYPGMGPAARHALQVLHIRGPGPENPERNRASQKYWASCKAGFTPEHDG